MSLWSWSSLVTCFGLIFQSCRSHTWSILEFSFFHNLRDQTPIVMHPWAMHYIVVSLSLAYFSSWNYPLHSHKEFVPSTVHWAVLVVSQCRLLLLTAQFLPNISSTTHCAFLVSSQDMFESLQCAISHQNDPFFQNYALRSHNEQTCPLFLSYFPNFIVMPHCPSSTAHYIVIEPIRCCTKYCHHDIMQSVWVYHHSYFPPLQVLNLSSSCQALKIRESP